MTNKICQLELEWKLNAFLASLGHHAYHNLSARFTWIGIGYRVASFVNISNSANFHCVVFENVLCCCHHAVFVDLTTADLLKFIIEKELQKK